MNPQNHNAHSPSAHRTPSQKTWWRAIVTVLASFIGIRRAAEREKDLATLTPLQIIISGIIGAICFVLTLTLLVRWIVSAAQSG